MKKIKVKKSYFEYFDDRIDFICINDDGSKIRYKNISIINYDLGGTKIDNESKTFTVTVNYK